MTYKIKNLNGFKGYKIDTNGDIWSCVERKRKQRGYGSYSVIGGKLKRLKSRLVKGYCAIDLRFEGRKKTLKVHRLVAETFLQNIREFPFVCHKNDNKLDNRLKNLYWGTREDNARDAIKNGKYIRKIS